MTRWLTTTLFALALLFAACSKSSPLEIRVTNRGTVPIDSLEINFVGQVETFVAIAPDTSTAYRPIKKAYHYARIQGTTSGKKFGLLPHDYVGETPLSPGRYTYALKITAGSDQPQLECVKD